jgi:Zn finger protein HypA/HybF involved in hydrogenase expression
MHEYSIVSSLVDQVEHVVASHPGAIVRRVHVEVGTYAGVELSLLQTAYDTFRERTVCEGAELRIVSAPGDELMLQRIEMEVPDV